MLEPFHASQPLTLGVELELQIVNTRDFDLTRGAEALLHALEKRPRREAVKPEITESMIELNSAIQSGHPGLLEDLREVRASLCDAAAALNLGIAGGGAHPFHRWTDRRIFPTERFAHVSGLYGYLAKQFTVFGQHIHIGCASGDDAVYLIHRLARFIPHFIALSAASPFAQGEDTAFATSRLHAVSAFPLSGHMPEVPDWSAFEAYFDRLAGFGIVRSMKDFYWDIRPKPEYGTIEIRICDTPLDIETAAALAAYGQALCAWMLDERSSVSPTDDYLVYGYNRFQACRFGFRAEVIDPASRSATALGESIRVSLDRVAGHAAPLGGAQALDFLRRLNDSEINGASAMREVLAREGSVQDVVRAMCVSWEGSDRLAR